VNFLFRDEVFDARNTFAAGKPPEQRQFYEGSLTGPIGESKKSSFLLSLESDKDNGQAAVVATGANNVAINENVFQPMRHFFSSGRIFHDFSDTDHVWIGYSFEHQSNKNVGAGGNVLPEAATNTRFLEHEANVIYRHIFSPKWVNQLQFLVGHYDAPVFSLNENPQIVVSGFFTGGGAQADSRRTEYHFDGTEFLTYVNGKHQLVFGVDIPDISRRGADDFTNMAGTYTFANLADFEQGHAGTYLVQQGNGHVVFLEKVLSGFIEDTIRVTPNFSMSLGVRYYWQNYFHDDPNNLAPRIGFAWAPARNGKTIFRGGAGEFYDRSAPDCGVDAFQRREPFAVHSLKSPERTPFVQLSSDSRAIGWSADERGGAGSAAANSVHDSVQHWNRAASHGEEHVQRDVRGVAWDRSFPFT
jgi:outer membrane receptor protein involved in Fe transport